MNTDIPETEQSLDKRATYLSPKRKLGLWTYAFVALSLPFVKIEIKDIEWTFTTNLCALVLLLRLGCLAYRVYRRRDEDRPTAEYEARIDVFVATICLFIL